MNMSKKNYFTMADVSRALKVHYSTVWQWLDAGKIPKPDVQLRSRMVYSPERYKDVVSVKGTNTEGCHGLPIIATGSTLSEATKALHVAAKHFVDDLADFPESAEDVKFVISMNIDFSPEGAK